MRIPPMIARNVVINAQIGLEVAHAAHGETVSGRFALAAFGHGQEEEACGGGSAHGRRVTMPLGGQCRRCEDGGCTHGDGRLGRARNGLCRVAQQPQRGHRKWCRLGRLADERSRAFAITRAGGVCMGLGRQPVLR